MERKPKILKNITEMHNGKYQFHMAASCTHYLPTIISLLLNKSYNYLFLNELSTIKIKNKKRFLERKSQGNGPLAENYKSQTEPEV